MLPTIAWSDFAKKHSRKGTGNSYTCLSDDELVGLLKMHWKDRISGAGENGSLERKVLVPIPVALYALGKEWFVCAPRMPLKVGMPVHAEVVVRQDGEDPFVQTFITPFDAEQWGYIPVAAVDVKVVCYSAEALLENGGSRSSDAEWEIVTILCSSGEQEPMLPLAMARNFLEKPGGSKGVYTAQEFAEAIYYHSNRGIKIKELE